MRHVCECGAPVAAQRLFGPAPMCQRCFDLDAVRYAETQKLRRRAPLSGLRVHAFCGPDHLFDPAAPNNRPAQYE